MMHAIATSAIYGRQIAVGTELAIIAKIDQKNQANVKRFDNEAYALHSNSGLQRAIN